MVLSVSIACVILILQRYNHQVTGQLHKTGMVLYSSDVSNGFRLYLYIVENLPSMSLIHTSICFLPVKNADAVHLRFSPTAEESGTTS